MDTHKELDINIDKVKQIIASATATQDVMSAAREEQKAYKHFVLTTMIMWLANHADRVLTLPEMLTKAAIALYAVWGQVDKSKDNIRVIKGAIDTFRKQLLITGMPNWEYLIQDSRIPHSAMRAAVTEWRATQSQVLPDIDYMQSMLDIQRGDLKKRKALKKDTTGYQESIDQLTADIVNAKKALQDWRIAMVEHETSAYVQYEIALDKLGEARRLQAVKLAADENADCTVENEAIAIAVDNANALQTADVITYPINVDRLVSLTLEWVGTETKRINDAKVETEKLQSQLAKSAESQRIADLENEIAQLRAMNAA